MALRTDFHKWIPDEEDLVISLYDEGMGYDDISVTMNISRGAVKARIEKLRYQSETPHNNQRHHGFVDPRLLDDRDARARARDRRDLTGERFGDPPPGYSELDKRRGTQ
jgi:hypothetical protein